MLELAGIIILGILAQWLAWRTKVPAILPLIITGLIVGPISSLCTNDGHKWIEPIYDVDLGTGLFPGQSLFYFVSLAIGIILFEGGLTLKRKEIEGVGPAIGKLISIGSLVTFIGAGLATHWIMGLTWAMSFLFAGLIIVTGPTVIAPILQNVPLTRNVATVLKWEGILIDPIGALVAVLMYEFIASNEGTLEFTSHALIQFLEIILIGFALGFIAAHALYQMIKNELLPHYLLNVFTLAAVLAVFVLSDVLAHESGLLSVVIMGMVLGNMDVPQLKEILSFKESLSVLLISILFILLSANIDISDLLLLLDWRCLGLFATVVFVLRPLGVFLSTTDSELTVNEKLFISWVGPRGIVAAGIASLFGLKLVNQGVPYANYLTPLVFMIVLGTVLINATTARLVARLLGVTLDNSDGILFVGANKPALLMAKYLQDSGRHVVLIDNNENNVRKAKERGIEAMRANVYDDSLERDFELLDMGYLIAMTGSNEVNEYVCRKYMDIFGEKGTFRLISAEEIKKDRKELPDEGLFSPVDDYINLSEVARDYPQMQELPLRSKTHFIELVEAINQVDESIPLFVRDNDGRLHMITTHFENMRVETDNALVYMGKEYIDSTKPTEKELAE
ncbi:MAG: cation:proton antiporter [Saprospiraceae bacterium]